MKLKAHAELCIDEHRTRAHRSPRLSIRHATIRIMSNIVSNIYKQCLYDRMRAFSNRHLHSSHHNNLQFLISTKFGFARSARKIGMYLAKLFVHFVILIGSNCFSKVMIGTNEPEGFIELQESAIKMLTTCYVNRGKTLVLMGDFPGNFIKTLSSHRYFSLAFLDNERRTEKIIRSLEGKDLNRKHKADTVVVIVRDPKHFAKMLMMLLISPYHNPMASILVLGWHPQNICDAGQHTYTFLSSFDPNRMPNLKLMCRDRIRRTFLYGTNPFTNRVPEPWQLAVSVGDPKDGPVFHVLFQEYHEHVDMCKNLDFDKTRDLGGEPITVLVEGVRGDSSSTIVEDKIPFGEPMGALNGNDKRRPMSKRGLIDMEKAWNYIPIFIKHVNATLKTIWQPFKVGNYSLYGNLNTIVLRPTVLKTVQKIHRPYAYPHDTNCRYLLSQYRGDKSQMRKIIDVIDSYSWIGMLMVYVITLIFFKYFMRQHLLIGIMNLVRLTSNFGLTVLPSNLASQIYLGILLFFVVTMQGIFVGNLAALLTHDIPVRQVNTIHDLIDLGYGVYAQIADFAYFQDTDFNGRLVKLVVNEDCVPYVQRDSSMACVFWGTAEIDYALGLNLYVSKNCLVKEYFSNKLPMSWMMEERFNEFLRNMIAAGTLVSFDTAVNEKILLEAESQDADPEPRVMKLNDLEFAFIILGIGLGFAFISFVCEIMFRRFHRGVKRTRVVVLN